MMNMALLLLLLLPSSAPGCLCRLLLLLMHAMCSGVRSDLLSAFTSGWHAAKATVSTSLFRFDYHYYCRDDAVRDPGGAADATYYYYDV